MSDFLKAIIEGVAQAQQMQQPQRGRAPSGRAQSADPMADLLEQMMRGGTTQRRQQQQAPAGTIDMGDLIGTILGGSQRSGSTGNGGMADLIGAILGGGSQQRGQINPIAQLLAEKLDIPPELAQVAVSFFISKFLSKQFGDNGQTRDSFDIGRAKDSIDLDDLLDNMDNSSGLQTHFSDTGMARELAQQSGMDEKTAANALEEIVKIVGQQRQQPRPVDGRKVNLKGLLDTWD